MGIDYVALTRFVLFGISLLLASLAVVTWNRRRDAPGAGTYAVLIASMAVYAFGYAGEVAQTTVINARHWLDIEYLAVPWAGGLWILAASQGQRIRVRPVLLFLIPVVTFVFHFGNFHNLFYSGPMTMERHGPFWVLTAQRGPLSMLDNAYLLVAFLVGSWIYVAGFRHASDLYRKQALVMVLSSLLPFIGYFLYLSGLTPFGLDTAPFTLGLTCVLLYYGLFHFGVFDLAPLGRNLIFNSIRDGVLILDVRNRLLDFNPAALSLMSDLNGRSLGQELTRLLESAPPALNNVLVDLLQSPEETHEFSIGPSGSPLSYEVRSWPIAPGRDGTGLDTESELTSRSRLRPRPKVERIGRAIIFSDVTAQVRLREELRRQSETDVLTGIANRRRFLQALDIECLRYSRGQSPFSLLMIDLDNFKDVNDRFGHPAGDAVLRKMADTLVGILRKTDLPARFGGEEFSVLLAETRREGAMVIAERIRAAVALEPIDTDDHRIPVTISVGVASHANDSEAEAQILLKKADLALYRAKAAGRNRVETV